MDQVNLRRETYNPEVTWLKNYLSVQHLKNEIASSRHNKTAQRTPNISRAWEELCVAETVECNKQRFDNMIKCFICSIFRTMHEKMKSPLPVTTKQHNDNSQQHSRGNVNQLLIQPRAKDADSKSQRPHGSSQSPKRDIQSSGDMVKESHNQWNRYKESYNSEVTIFMKTLCENRCDNLNLLWNC